MLSMKNLFYMVTLLIFWLSLMFMSSENSFSKLLISLEMMMLVIVLSYVLSSMSWSVSIVMLMSMLVLSGVEASVGLSLLIYLSRVWSKEVKVMNFK